MFYGTTQSATNFTESMLRSWPVGIIKAILFFVPRANPAVERLYPQVKKWVIEVSDDGWPRREVALDSGDLPIFRLPNGRNTGFWTDMAKHRFEPTDLVAIDAVEFDRLWAAAQANLPGGV